MSHQEWAQKFQDWAYVRDITQKMEKAVIENAVRKVMQEMLDALFGSKK